MKNSNELSPRLGIFFLKKKPTICVAKQEPEGMVPLLLRTVVSSSGWLDSLYIPC